MAEGSVVLPAVAFAAVQEPVPVELEGLLELRLLEVVEVERYQQIFSALELQLSQLGVLGNFSEVGGAKRGPYSQSLLDLR